MNAKDKETQDLLHKIELDGNQGHRNRAATALRIVRIERRESKDFVERNKPIVDFIADNKPTFDKMTQLLGLVRKAEQKQVGRRYIPRVRKDLTIGDENS